MTPIIWTTSEKVSLLLALVPYLKQQGATSISELSLHFGISEKMLRKLIGYLSLAGVPGETGTYQHEDLFDINWTLFDTHDEVELVHTVGLDNTPRFTSAQAAALIAGLNSIEMMLDDTRAPVAASAAEKLARATYGEPASLSFGDGEEPLRKQLAEINSAIEAGAVISFSYRDRNGEVTQRHVDPYRVILLRGVWYLQGWCHTREAERMFRVQFVQKLLITDTTQQKPNSQPKPGRISDVPVTPADGVGGEGTLVDLLVEPEVEYLLDGWNPSFTGMGPRGKVRLSVALLNDARVIALVCTAPGRIEVTGPTHLRNLVREWAEEMSSVGTAGNW